MADKLHIRIKQITKHPYIKPIWAFYYTVILIIFTIIIDDLFHSDLLRFMAIFIVFIVFTIIFLLLSKNHFKFNFGEHLPPPSPKKGLILLVSRVESAMHTVQYHKDKGKLKRVWLIPSNNKEKEYFGSSSKNKANEIIKACDKISIDAKIAQEVSPADAQETFDAVRRIYRNSSKYNMEPIEIIADFTGGTKPMTLGMIMACLPPERQLEYVSFNAETKEMHGPYFIDYRHELFDLIE